MKTIAIIVSYANRYELCRQVVESCLAEEVYKIIVVNNGSAKESEEQLKQLEQRHNSTVEVVTLPTNTPICQHELRHLRLLSYCRSRRSFHEFKEEEKIFDEEFQPSQPLKQWHRPTRTLSTALA